MLGPCTAGNEEAECDCEDFAPKASDPKQCRRCLHSERHHVADSDASESEDDTVQAILESSMAAVRTQKEPSSSSRLGGRSGRGGMSTLFKKADLESAAGMRPVKKASAKKGKEKSKAKAGKFKAKASTPVEDVVAFESIMMLVEGVNEDAFPLAVVEDQIPDLSDIVAARNAGLAYMPGGDGILFPVNATAEEVIVILRRCIPKVFAYLDDLSPAEFVDDAGETVVVPGWVTVLAKRQRLKVVEFPELTGRELQSIVRNSKVKINHLTLCTRAPIPQEILVQWSKRFQKKGGSSNDRPKRKHKSKMSDNDASSSESEPRAPAKKARRSQRSSVGNAVAGPSTLTGTNTGSPPIDLTRSPSPPLFYTQPTSTPTRPTIPEDLSYSRASDTDPTVPNPYDTPFDFSFD